MNTQFQTYTDLAQPLDDVPDALGEHVLDLDSVGDLGLERGERVGSLRALLGPRGTQHLLAHLRGEEHFYQKEAVSIRVKKT